MHVKSIPWRNSNVIDCLLPPTAMGLSGGFSRPLEARVIQAHLEFYTAAPFIILLFAIIGAPTTLTIEVSPFIPVLHLPIELRLMAEAIVTVSHRLTLTICLKASRHGFSPFGRLPPK